MCPIFILACFSTIVISQKQSAYNAVPFKWIEFNNRFDCIAGISADGKPVSTGVFISTRTVLTSANPLQQYINKRSTDGIEIHTVTEVFNNSRSRKVESLAGNQSFRNQYWVNIGYEKLHTTVHDILLITVSESDRIEKTQGSNDRMPFPVNLPNGNGTFLPPGRAVFAGFGYMDEKHVRENLELEVTYYEDSTITDCDEWIPREWGRFICLLNDENLVGVSSGMPLFRDSNMETVVGIGCFALKKGDESVLIFTDLRPYADHLYGYLKDDADTGDNDVIG